MRASDRKAQARSAAVSPTYTHGTGAASDMPAGTGRGGAGGGAGGIDADECAVLDVASIRAMDVGKLRRALSLRDLDASGVKAELVARLEGAEAVRRSMKRKAHHLSAEVDESAAKCPICFDWLRGVIYQCSDGHSLCAHCKPKVRGDRCPTCRAALGTIRARGLETMLEGVRMPCVWCEHGCRHVATRREREIHEKTCEFQKVLCPFDGCEKFVDPLDLFEHFLAAHMTKACMQFTIGDPKRFELVDHPSRTWISIFWILCGGELYLIRQGCLSDSFNFTFMHVPVIAEAKPKALRIKFELKGDQQRLVMDFKPHSIPGPDRPPTPPGPGRMVNEDHLIRCLEALPWLLTFPRKNLKTLRDNLQRSCFAAIYTFAPDPDGDA